MLNSVRVQVTGAFSFYSDIAKCRSLLLDYQFAKYSIYIGNKEEGNLVYDQKVFINIILIFSEDG